MSTILNILVGTDFSRASHTAVQRGVQLAATHGAALRLVHAVDRDRAHSTLLPSQSIDRAASTSSEERTRQRLQDLAASLMEQAGLDVTIHIEPGPPAQVINAQAQEVGSPLVVIGSRADATISGLGSTAAKVVRTPTRPVLVVRAAGSGAYERVVLATDMREGAARAASFAVELFPSARHHLLHALDPGHDGDALMQELAPDELAARQQRHYEMAKARLSDVARQLSARTLHPVLADVAEDVPARAVLVYAADLPADCVVVGHHAGEPDPEFILGSLAQHVIYSSICDVLVVP